jgi:hypothetical protein
LRYVTTAGIGPEKLSYDGLPRKEFYVHQYKAKLYLPLQGGENIFLTLCRVQDSETRFRFVSSDSTNSSRGEPGSEVTVLLIWGEGGRGVHSEPEVTLYPLGEPARFEEMDANLRQFINRETKYPFVGTAFQPSQHAHPVLIFKDPGLNISEAIAGYRDDITKLLPRSERTEVPDCPPRPGDKFAAETQSDPTDSRQEKGQ